MLDRFDLNVEVAPVEFSHLSSKEKEEPSAVIRERVQRVRDIQNNRFKGTPISCNAGITADIINEVCPLTRRCKRIVEETYLSV